MVRPPLRAPPAAGRRTRAPLRRSLDHHGLSACARRIWLGAGAYASFDSRRNRHTRRKQSRLAGPVRRDMNSNVARSDAPPLKLLSIVIPARDEEGCIASTVEHLYVELNIQGIPHEIVVV